MERYIGMDVGAVGATLVRPVLGGGILPKNRLEGSSKNCKARTIPQFPESSAQSPLGRS